MTERGLALPVTVFPAELAQVRVVARDSIAAEDAADPEWDKLSAELLPSANVYRPAAAKAQAKKNEAVVGETFYLVVVARNPLDAPLAIGGLEVATDAAEGLVEIDAPGELELEAKEAKTVSYPLRSVPPSCSVLTSHDALSGSHSGACHRPRLVRLHLGLVSLQRPPPDH